MWCSGFYSVGLTMLYTDKEKGLNANQMKLTAIAAMTPDHLKYISDRAYPLVSVLFFPVNTDSQRIRQSKKQYRTDNTQGDSRQRRCIGYVKKDRNDAGCAE